MKKNFWIAAVMIVLLAVAGGKPVLAGQANKSAPRARLRENISLLYLLRLTQALELTEDQTARIYPVLTRIEKEKAGLQQNLSRQVLALREALKKGEAGERELVELVGKARETRNLIRAKDEEADAFLEQNLDPVQEARYILFSIDFLRRLNETMDRARQARSSRMPVKR